MRHASYQPIKTEEYGTDWITFPVDGYGTQDMVRSLLRQHKPDILWFMTDPRFYGWLWEIENEVRALCPMVYYHVRDNFPIPYFNKLWYHSNDEVVTISKVTDKIVSTTSPEAYGRRIPHAVNSSIFHPFKDAESKQKVSNLKERLFDASKNHKNPKKACGAPL